MAVSKDPFSRGAPPPVFSRVLLSVTQLGTFQKRKSAVLSHKNIHSLFGVLFENIKPHTHTQKGKT